MARTAAALIIGDEILSGKIQEANLVELARLLRSLGIELRRVVFLPDEVKLIAREVSRLASTHDDLFTSGGVGPTHDDVTLDGVARAFRVPVVIHPELLQLYKGHFGENLNEGHLRLASVPSGARLLSIAASRWPVVVMGNVWILPGIPEVFRMKLPILRQHLQADTPFISRAVYTGMEESDLKALLDRVVAKHPQVVIGSYPTWSDPRYRTKITFDGKQSSAIERAVKDLLALLPDGEPQWIE